MVSLSKSSDTACKQRIWADHQKLRCSDRLPNAWYMSGNSLRGLLLFKALLQCLERECVAYSYTPTGSLVARSCSRVM